MELLVVGYLSLLVTHLLKTFSEILHLSHISYLNHLNQYCSLKTSEYSKLTWTYLEKLWKPLLAGKMGVSLVPCIQTFDRTPPVPVVSDIVYGFQTIDSEELSSFNKPAWKYGNI